MFKKGSYQFNNDPNFNFQLNRLVMWENGDPNEIQKVSKDIVDSKSWVKTLLGLAEKAEKNGQIEAQIGYLRMSEFFMFESDPLKIETYRKAKELFYRHNEGKMKEYGVISSKVPYGEEGGYLPVLSCKAKGPCQGRLLLHGGNDSYIEEFFDGFLYFQEQGFDVYLFEGPGQGGVLREQNMKFEYQWEKPVTTVIDYFNLEDVTIIGTSLGGYLAPRAAAFEKRITKVIGWSIFPDFFEGVMIKNPKIVNIFMDIIFKMHLENIFNPVYNKLMEKDEMLKWGILHGLYAYGGKTPMDFARKLRQFTLKGGVGERVTQDVLILGAKEDHFIDPKLFHLEYDLLPNARSLAFQLYTNQDDAGSHCNVGNMKLTLDTMISWIQQMNAKNNHMKSQ